MFKIRRIFKTFGPLTGAVLGPVAFALSRLRDEAFLCGDVSKQCTVYIYIYIYTLYLYSIYIYSIYICMLDKYTMFGVKF